MAEENTQSVEATATVREIRLAELVTAKGNMDTLMFFIKVFFCN